MVLIYEIFVTYFDWSFSIEILIRKVGISIYIISIFLSFYGRQKIVFLHYTKYCFGIDIYSLSFKLYMYYAIIVCIIAFLTFPYLFCANDISFDSIAILKIKKFISREKFSWRLSCMIFIKPAEIRGIINSDCLWYLCDGIHSAFQHILCLPDF